MKSLPPLIPQSTAAFFLFRQQMPSRFSVVEQQAKPSVAK
jgi:hypothetical protein